MTPLGSKASASIFSFYGMIRQPTKIFCILPPLLAVAAPYRSDVSAWRPALRWPILVCSGLVLCAALEFKLQVRATICLLDETKEPTVPWPWMPPPENRKAACPDRFVLARNDAWASL